MYDNISLSLRSLICVMSYKPVTVQLCNGSCSTGDTVVHVRDD